MSVARSAESRRGSWVSGLLFLAGALLVAWCVWRGIDGGQVVLLILGAVAAVWGFRDGGFRWLRAIPGTILAFLVGGGNRQARRYEARLTREALIYTIFMVVVLLGSLLGHSNMLLLVFALMAGAFVLNGQATMSVIRRTRARRILPDLVFAGEPCAVRIELSNRKRWMSSWMVQVEDTLRLEHEVLHPTVLFERVPARSSREASYQVTPGRRGVLEFLPLRIGSRFPLGLWERGFEIDIEEQLLILPRIGRLTPRFQNTLRAHQRSQLDAPARAGVFDEEFHRLREFRGGDSRRAIHWRTTARRNELMVREYQEQHDPELLVLLELWLPEHPGAEDRERVEQAVSFAATCCVTRARATMDTGIQLIVCAARGEVLGAAGVGLPLRLALESLAVVSGTTRPDWGPATGELPQRTGDGCRKVFVTTHPDGRERLRQMTDSGAADWETLQAEFEVLGDGAAPLADYFSFDTPPGGGR